MNYENEIETHGTVAPAPECLLGITRTGCASPESKQGMVVYTYNPTFGKDEGSEVQDPGAEVVNS